MWVWNLSTPNRENIKMQKISVFVTLSIIAMVFLCGCGGKEKVHRHGGKFPYTEVTIKQEFRTLVIKDEGKDGNIDIVDIYPKKDKDATVRIVVTDTDPEDHGPYTGTSYITSAGAEKYQKLFDDAISKKVKSIIIGSA